MLKVTLNWLGYLLNNVKANKLISSSANKKGMVKKTMPLEQKPFSFRLYPFTLKISNGSTPV